MKRVKIYEGFFSGIPYDVWFDIASPKVIDVGHFVLGKLNETN